MINHVVVGTNDIERSRRFYDAVLGALGAGAAVRNVAASGHARLFYRHDGGSFCVSQPIDDRPASPANGGTIAFRCGSPDVVRAFHDAAVAHGGVSIEDPPGIRHNPMVGPVYLAYVRDPDGNKLGAVCRGAT